MFELPPPPGKFALIKGLNIHYEVVGTPDKPALICIHGLLSSTIVWQAIRESLGRHFQLYLIDLPNHGYSEKSEAFSMALLDHAELVAAFMDERQLTRCSVLGHSMGGGVAIYLASRHPHRVDHVILVDSLSYPFPLPFKGKIATLPGVGKFLLTYCYNRAILKSYFANDVFYDKHYLTEREVDTLYASFNSPVARAGILHAIAQTHNPVDLAKEIPNIAAPTLVIWGENDKLIPPSLADRLVREIPDARKIVISECGHQPMSEKPERFITAVRDFLAI